MTYDILIQNNSKKSEYLYTGITDNSTTKLYHSFDLDLSDLPDGEYTAYIVRNELTGVTWTTKDVPLESTLTYDGVDYKLRDLKSEIEMIKIGASYTEDTSSYKTKDVEYQFYKRNNN